MHELAPVSPFVALAYLIAGVLFILALRGLSSPATSRRGNRMGMIGMAIAVVTTLYTHDIASLPEIIGAILIGGGIGFVIARRIAMTAMPQLVAAMHSLVGLAAVFVGYNAYIELGNVLAMGEEERNALEGFAAILAHKTPIEQSILKVEVFLGVFIGAVTFTGSVVAFGKLAGKLFTRRRRCLQIRGQLGDIFAEARIGGSFQRQHFRKFRHLAVQPLKRLIAS